MKYLLIAIALVFTILSCKKGEEDPAISLLSRKARLVGEWDLKDLSKSNTTPSDTTLTISMTDHNYFSLSEVYGGPPLGYRIQSERDIEVWKLIIEEDGSWNEEIRYHYVDEYHNLSFQGIQHRDGYKVEYRQGTWSFLGKVKKTYKNKERILFHVTTDSVFFGMSNYLLEFDDGSPDEMGTIPEEIQTSHFGHGVKMKEYSLLRLSSKEMKWELESSTSTNGTQYFRNYLWIWTQD